MNIKDITRKLAITGALGALSIVLALTSLGMIPFPLVSVTILHIPVIIGAILEGPLVGLGIGLIFGIYSMIMANIAPAGAFDSFFANPLISVLPRLLIGPTTFVVYSIIKKWKLYPAIIMSTFIGSIANTFFVLLALLCAGAITWALFATIFITNGLLEAIVCMILASAVISAWKHIGSRKKSRISEE